MLYLVVCGKRFHGQSVLSVPQNIFPLLHREMCKACFPCAIPPRDLLGKSRGDTLQCKDGDGTPLMPTAEALEFSLLPPQPSWFLCTRQRIRRLWGSFASTEEQETARTSLCFCKQNTVLFGHFSHFFSSQLLGSVFSPPKQQELSFIRWIILRLVERITEVPVSTASTRAPGAITWQGVHKRHKDWF